MAATIRLLVVEDEQRLAAGLRKGFEAEGFAVDVVHNGTDGIWMARENPDKSIRVHERHDNRQGRSRPDAFPLVARTRYGSATSGV